MMRKKLFGKLGRIKPAPKRFRLVEFGGDLTVEKFRENLLIDDDPPRDVITEPAQNIILPNVSNNAKMQEIKSASGRNNSLKLKREKPLKRDQNNLESVLGLIIKPNN